ncbi:MAG TPA: tRNA uridine-5-carboxymethylaminomethyl(34) synthesis GTPase MnmE [Caulobacteraceae bacterium]|jgi:tRNA modification GTPase
MTDTLFALATAPGRAAVAVLRLSGPGAAEAVKRLAGRLPPPREARLRVLRNETGEELDRALVLWLPGPHSYTGEDSAELHLHGGAAVVDAVSEALLTGGLRPAQPGEFTRRAFENGRLDLVQAEAVADLVDAETEAQRRQALAQLEGALSRRHADWRELIVEALAVLEAAIDFPDEDLPEDVAVRARPPLERLLAGLEEALADAARGERVREGYRIAIVGAPNAGKSSLLNRLAGRDAAIVTPVAGATRDVIELPLVIAGYKALVADTAGLREPGDAIEAEGVRRARAWAEGADLRLWVIDASAGEGAWREAADVIGRGDLALLNKSDLAPGPDAVPAAAAASAAGADALAVSCAGSASLNALTDALEARVVSALGGGEFPAATRARHRQELGRARDHAARALGVLSAGAELAAEDVRLAARALARITGGVDAESVLDRVFASFCIGK